MPTDLAGARMRRRGARCAALALVTAMWAPVPAAHATRAGEEPDHRLHIIGDAGEANDLVITEVGSGGDVVIDERAPGVKLRNTFGIRCHGILGGRLRCNDPSSLFIELKDGNDRVRVDAAETTEILGGPGNDVVIGGSDADKVDGGAGDDTLTGRGGNDQLVGGSGAEDGKDVISGGDGDDSVHGAVGADILDGDAGDDEGTGGSGDDTIRGGDGDDCFFFGGSGVDTMDGGPGNDCFQGGDGNDFVQGGSGDDRVAGEEGNDKLDGGTGKDRSDSVDPGTDVWTYESRSTPVLINVGGLSGAIPQGLLPPEGDTVSDAIEIYRGGQANDVLRGNVAANRLEGGPGDDKLDGGLGPDVLDGGPGTDTVDYQTRTAPVTVLPSTSAVGAGGNGEPGEGDGVVLVENALTGSGDDNVGGVRFASTGAGADQLVGTPLDDVLDGGPGPDVIDGAGGVDTATYADRTTPVTATLDNQANDGGVEDAGPGGVRDKLLLTIENIRGGLADDVLKGNSLPGFPDDNGLFGGPGADTLDGLAGADTLLGEAGADTIHGGPGGDSVTGGPGVDNLFGDEGADTVDASGDGLAEVVRCGADADTAIADLVDTFTPVSKATPTGDCETVQRAQKDQHPLVRITSRSASVRRGGTVAIGLSCPRKARATCAGRLTLESADAGRRTLGAARYRVRRGHRGTATVRLRGVGNGGLAARAIARERDARGRPKTTSAPVTLRR